MTLSRRGFIGAAAGGLWLRAQEQRPVFRVKVVSRTTKAVNYRHRGGSTTVDFRGTELMPEVGGRAKVDGKEYPVFHIETSSASHPFYTCNEKIMDTAGRIDRFKAKQAKATKKVVKK